MPLLDEVNGKRLVINYDVKHDLAIAYDEQGVEMSSVVAYWFAWCAFYPDTEIFKAQ